MTSTRTTKEVEEGHRSIIYQSTLTLRILFFGILCLGTLLPQFDASALLVPTTWPANNSLLRWDTFHFLHISEYGYVYEHEWAFLPAVPYFMRIFRFLVRRDIPTNSDILWPAMLSALVCDSSMTLYTLSLHHLRSAELAFLASLLSVLPTSPVILYFAPYNETYFTYFSLRGMLSCTRKEWFKASLWFAVAGTFRSNGIFLSGYILWGLLVQPLLARNKPTLGGILKSVLYTAIVVAPFVAYQSYAYTLFCSGDRNPTPQWCSDFPPSIYNHVQSKYWNVGFLNYWKLSQLPNFIIATPTLALIFAFAIYHLRKTTLVEQTKEVNRTTVAHSFENASLTPHAIHATIFALILLFGSHTQVVLRLAHSLPFLYWGAAWLLTQHPSLGQMWVTWSVVWGVISIILWAVFLPPA